VSRRVDAFDDVKPASFLLAARAAERKKDGKTGGDRTAEQVKARKQGQKQEEYEKKKEKNT